MQRHLKNSCQSKSIGMKRSQSEHIQDYKTDQQKASVKQRLIETDCNEKTTAI